MELKDIEKLINEVSRIADGLELLIKIINEERKNEQAH